MQVAAETVGERADEPRAPGGPVGCRCGVHVVIVVGAAAASDGSQMRAFLSKNHADANHHAMIAGR